MNVIRQPLWLCGSSKTTLNSALASAGPSYLQMSPLQASALQSAYSYVNDYDCNDFHSDEDLEDLSFVEPRPLMKRRVRLDYVSDYEWDEDNDYLEDYDSDGDNQCYDDACSIDSDLTLTVSNRACAKQLSPVSSSTNSTATMDSDCCSISSGLSFDSEVAVSKHHQPTPIYHHHHHHHHRQHFSPASAQEETRHSFSSLPSTNNMSAATPNMKKPFVRADLMPTPLSTRSSSQQLLTSIPCSPKRGPINRRLFRTFSSQSTASAMTI
ncbi:unnamed protein product [Cylindrotheca closterium]|uniref:Uncharacterized protein n=1 Tax=Cylindrotheca closterium TaxID=2856 RepID=A0AAD2FNI4_9STRA|nr:unnamed protein product [Cylindrotheca closterium]